ncbi:LysR family transcriptional regulator [Jannaschia sp. 2305UL9-9]|uniref:LysR family transcriptional regulator n=1 Tax=Jannaschia sp. 2305UL9-9 TaxID=3121638 RepID=UPI003529C3CA
MTDLNYHHLRYFHAVAHAGHLTRAAETLNLSQSALSAQIRALEDRLGHALFDRVGRRLELTEVGRVTLTHADRIFSTGAELLATLDRSGSARAPLRVGALSTLSRNFQLSFLAPLLGRDDVDVILRSGNSTTLMAALRGLDLDVVLTTSPPAAQDAEGTALHGIADQPVGLHGRADLVAAASLADLMATRAFILPTEPAIRCAFHGLADRLGVTPRIAALVDDMAMVRLLARAGAGVAVAPAVVLADEIAAGMLATAPFDLAITERFYAVTMQRAFPHPLLAQLLGHDVPAP